MYCLGSTDEIVVAANADDWPWHADAGGLLAYLRSWRVRQARLHHSRRGGHHQQAPTLHRPSLLGLPAQIDLKGATYREAKGKIERVATEFPTANLADLRDLDKLDYLAKQVSLFTVKYPPEVEKLTELAWRKQGDGYVLPVMRERLTLARDLRDEWWVRGSLNGKAVEVHAQNLAGAFNIADREVMASGDRKPLVMRDARWHGQKPTEKQVGLCRKLGLAIPAGASRGQVSAALDSHFGRG